MFQKSVLLRMGVARRISRLSNSQGVAFIELAAVAPLIVLLIFSVVDVGRALVAYLELSRVVYEGARFAGTITELEDSQSSGTTDVSGAPIYENLDLDGNGPPCSVAGTRNQCAVHQRVRYLFDQAYQLDSLLVSPQIQTQFIPVDSADGTPDIEQGYVIVTVRSSYQGFFKQWFNIPLTSRVVGPYLSGSAS